VVIVTDRHLNEAAAEHKDAATDLAAWRKIVEAARWKNFAELRSQISDADAVDGYIVFNIRHNHYRLITVIHYSKDVPGRTTQGHCYIRSFLTHAEYNNKANWDKRFAK